MPQLNLFDHKSQTTYVLHVTEEDFIKANNDVLFATHLLQKTLNNKANETNTASASQLLINEPEACMSSDNEKVQEPTDVEDKDSFRWPHEAILLLIELYKENENKLTSGKMSVKKFWEMVSSLMIEKGYHVTGTQCKSKMAGLKNTYKNVKDHNSKSGNSTRQWKYFNILDEMFNNKPWITPVSTLDTGKPMSLSSLSVEEDCDENIPSSTETKIPIKRKRRTVLENMLEENTMARKKMHEEAMIRQDKLLDILSKLLEK